MTYSLRFKALERRFKDLRQRFLPKQFSKTGSYNASQMDYARAFRILMHAEIEHYFEDRAVEIAAIALSLFIKGNKPSLPCLAFMANISGTAPGLPDKIGSNVAVGTVVTKAFGQYKHSIESNHGIKIANILKMLLPIGVVEGDIDQVWLSTIDGFGANRGTSAHKSAVSHTINPHDEFKTVVAVMLGIKDIDIVLSNLKKSCK